MSSAPVANSRILNSRISNSTFKTKITDNVTRVAIATSFGYLVGRLVEVINPGCGAIFALVATTIHLISKEAFNKSEHSSNKCFISSFIALTTGYIIANYFATFAILHGLIIYSLGVISVVAIRIILNRI